MNGVENNENMGQIQEKTLLETRDLLIDPQNKGYLDVDCLKATKFLAVIHKIFGVLLIIEGVLISLTLIGALLGVPLILAGKKLFDSGGNLSNFNISNGMGDIRSFFGNYKKYWKNVFIIFILQIVSVFLIVLFSIVSLIMSTNSTKSSDIKVYPDYNTQTSTSQNNSNETQQTVQENTLSIRKDLDLNELHNLMEEVVTNGNENELSKYTKEELKVLRNMIFAEKGYIFEGGELEKYFKQKSWYKPYIKNQDDIELNEYEKAFVALLRKYEGIPNPENKTTNTNTVSKAKFRTSRNANEIDLDELHDLMNEVVTNGNEKVLAEYSKRELKIIRNMIFAEKGYIFEGGEMSEYFNNKSWYEPYIEDQNTIELDEYEKAFVNKVKKYEGN